MNNIYRYEFRFEVGKSILTQNNLNEKKLGRFLCETDSYNIPVTDILKQHNFKFDKITKEDLVDKSIYRTSNLMLPKNKVDLLKEDCNLKVTRNKEKADYIIIGESFIEDCIAKEYSSIIDYENFIKLINNDEFKKFFTKEAYDSFISIIPEEGMFEINSYHRWGDNISSTASTNFDALIHKHYTYGSSYIVYIKNEDIADYDYVLNSNNIVLDSNILEISNADLHVMSNEEFETYKKLLDSDNINREDLNIILELMSNCNLQKCGDKIAYLYYFNESRLRICDNWNHINVKSLRSFMPTVRHHNHTSYYYERFISYLQDKNILTEYIVKHVFKHIIDCGLATFGFNKGMFKIDPNNLELSDEYKPCVIPNDTGLDVLEQKDFTF